MAQMVLSHLQPAPEPLTEQPSAELEEEMEKVPETYKLDEDDIREAITEWLNEHHQNDYNYDYDISFKVTQKEDRGMDLDPRIPRGGMSDPVIKTVITAIAVKEE
jgi:hypothetical protein